uniref:Protein IQ-DOMAIN 1 n=1 Tax=Cajanus cajan TaxID=3821 RepID=A0A151TEN9_CAJCA|nr:Protein IQ-DOMAIN 1 [Cajanus cajan]
MGVSGKWIKALVGRKKSEKPDSLEKDGIGNKVSKYRDQKKHSVEFDDGKLPNEFDSDATQPTGDNNGHTNTDAHCSPSTSQQAHDADHNHQNRQEWAAIRIQTAFRGFLARRALRALKGVVKLQALVRGYAVRKQAAITLRCMQALVRVQARVRARHVRMSLETQAAQQKLQQKLPNKVQVREIEEGWCDSVGSVEEIQTKILKRQEAAAKRERAMAYALAHQWQAGSRQQPVSSGFEPDKSSWGWNWLERWMAVRPWENRFVDINLRHGLMMHENGAKDGQNGTAHQLRPANNNKKPFSSNLHPLPASSVEGVVLDLKQPDFLLELM